MPDQLLIMLVILLCLLAQGFFSGSEIALVSLNRLRLKHQAQNKSRTAALIEQGLSNPEWLLSTTLVGTNLAMFTSNTLATLLVVSLYGPRYELLVILVMWPLLLVFGEIIPKTLFQHKANFLSRVVIYPLRVFSVLLAPLVWLVSTLAKLFLRLFGLYAKDARRLLSREDFRAMIKSSVDGGPIDKLEETMIQRVLAFGDKTVKEAMIPLVEVVAIDKSADWEQLCETVVKHAFTRYPVFEKRVDNIVGMIHSFDLLGRGKPQRGLPALIRPAYYAPENAPVDKVLLEMQAQGQPMAIVVDEYGGAVGILTLEDIVEEIVGEIEDEYGDSKALYRKLGNKRWLINARIEIERLEELLEVSLPRGDFETLAGFLISNMETIPEVGELFHFSGVEFKVTRASDRMVEEVQASIP